MTQLLKYIESQYTGEVRLKPEMVSFETEGEELRFPDYIYVHRAMLRISLQYHWPVNAPPPELPDYVVAKFARELYGELERDLLELQYQLFELRSMGVPVEKATTLVNRILKKIHGED